MGWFEHRHNWRFEEEIGLFESGTVSAGARPRGIMRIEKCPCGMWRTVEINQGAAPVIRESVTKPLPEPPKP